MTMQKDAENNKFETFGASPVQGAVECLMSYELMAKQVALLFAVPYELLYPSDKCTCKVSMPSPNYTIPTCKFCGKPQAK